MPDMLDSLAPLFTTSRIRLPDGSVAYGSNALQEVQNPGRNYTRFLQGIARETQMTPLLKHLKMMQVSLAAKINEQYFGMDPRSAREAAVLPGVGSMAASQLLQRSGAYDVLPAFDSFMRQAGVSSDLVAGPEARARNQAVGRFANFAFRALADPRYAGYWKGVSPQDRAQIVLNGYQNGDFADLLQADRGVGFSQNTGRKLMARMAGLVRASGEMATFLGSSPAEAREQMSRLFGRDPVRVFGTTKTEQLFAGLRRTSDVLQLEPQQAATLISNLASAYRDTGRDPLLALEAARTSMSLSQAARDLHMGNVDPGRYSQSLLTTISDAPQTKVGKMLAAGYGALATHMGERKAHEVIGALSQHPKNFETVAGLAEALNQYLPDTGKLTPETFDTYLASKPAKAFLSTGRGLQASLRRTASDMRREREQYLTGQGYAPEELREIKNSFGLTAAGISKYLRSRPGTPLEQEQRQQRLLKGLSELSSTRGFESPEAQDIFLNSMSNKRALRAIQESTARLSRIEQGFGDKGRVRGAEGLTRSLQTASRPQSAQELFGNVVGQTDLSGADLERMHGAEGARQLQERLYQARPRELRRPPPPEKLSWSQARKLSETGMPS